MSKYVDTYVSWRDLFRSARTMRVFSLLSIAYTAAMPGKHLDACAYVDSSRRRSYYD